MRRLSIGRLIAVALLATIVLLLSIDTTQACRYLWGRHRPACPPVVCAPVSVVCQPSTCSPCWTPVVYGVSTCSPCPPPVCCGGTVVGDVLIEGPVVVDSCGVTTSCEPIVEAYQAIPAEEPTPAEPDATDSVVPADAESPLDALDAAPAESDAIDEPVLLPDGDDEAAVAPLLDDVLPGADTLPEADALPGADTLPGADALPGADTLPEAEVGPPADSLPGADTMPETDALPGETPADGGLDIFDDTPAPATEPATDSLPDATMDDSLDDIFAEPPATDPAVPATDEAPAGDQPAGEGTDNLDDLFGGATDTSGDMAPAAVGADDAAADDLFGGLDPAAPADQTTEEAPGAAEELLPAEDLTPAEDTQAPTEENDTTDLDDLFGQRPVRDGGDVSSSTTRVANTQPSQLPFRVWTDNTGHYQTVGRLVQVGKTHIRLLKSNGRHSTVPKERLSQADLGYVDQMVKQLGLKIVDQLARR